jgi:hypothetical protein
MNVIIQFRRGTAAEWTAANPTLALGEVGYETDTGKIKVGNGSTAWNGLSYSSEGPTGPTGPTGPAGPTGADGPNNITTSTTTDLNGFLFGDGDNVSAVSTIDGGEPSTTF